MYTLRSVTSTMCTGGNAEQAIGMRKKGTEEKTHRLAPSTLKGLESIPVHDFLRSIPWHVRAAVEVDVRQDGDICLILSVAIACDVEEQKHNQVQKAQ
jgi:hypothetical protein